MARVARPERAPSGAAGAEREFLDAYDPSRFERPSVTVDVVLVSAIDGSLFTLTVRRAEHPYCGWQALPGGFVRIEESLDSQVPAGPTTLVLTVGFGVGGALIECRA
jgi:hypothetical protein